jgi:hypothetical protein
MLAIVQLIEVDYLKDGLIFEELIQVVRLL